MPKFGKCRFWLLLLVGGLGLLGPFGISRLSAQMNGMPLGSVVRNFVMPQRDAQGDLQANITGDQATIVSYNRTQIINLKVELYDSSGQNVTTTVTSPRCDYWTLERRLSSSDGVLLVRPESRITADAVEWDFKTQIAVLHSNVKVVLPKFTIGGTPSS